MESENNFIPKPEKPPVLYHASRNSSIKNFEPRIGKRRYEKEGPKIYATPSKAMATVFLVDTDDSWTKSGSIDGVPYIVISDKERFESLDVGGAIYSLPSDTFEDDPNIGLGELEYTSEESVTPIGYESVNSSFNTMLDNGVQVFFVDKETFRAIEDSPDHGVAIIAGLNPVTK